MEKSSNPKEAKAVDIQDLSQEQLAAIVEKSDEIDASDSKIPTLDKRSMLGEELGFPAAHNLSNQEVGSLIDQARTRSEVLIHEAKQAEFAHVVEAADKAESMADLRTALSKEYGFRKIYEMNNLELKAFVADARKSLEALDKPDESTELGRSDEISAPNESQPQPVDVPREPMPESPQAKAHAEARTDESLEAVLRAEDALRRGGGPRFAANSYGEVEDLTKIAEDKVSEAQAEEPEKPKEEEKPVSEAPEQEKREATPLTDKQLKALARWRETINTAFSEELEYLRSATRKMTEGDALDVQGLREKITDEFIEKLERGKKFAERAREYLLMDEASFSKLFGDRLRAFESPEASAEDPTTFNIEQVYDLIDFRNKIDDTLQSEGSQVALNDKIRWNLDNQPDDFEVRKTLVDSAKKELREELIKKLVKAQSEGSSAKTLNWEKWANLSEDEFNKSFERQMKLINEARDQVAKEEAEEAERKEQRKNKRLVRRLGAFMLGLKWDEKSGTYLPRDNLLK